MSTPHFKRAAPFAPTDITGCQLWLDANDTTTISLAGNTVTQINDKSVNANNTTSSTGTVTYAATGLNGRPAFSFNATGGFRGPTSITGTTLTAFTVATLNSGVNYNGRLLGLANATQNDYAYATTGQPFFCRNGGPNVSGYRNNTYMSYQTNTFDTPFIGTSQFTGSSNIISINSLPGTAVADANGSFSITKYGFGCEGLSDAGVNWYGYCSEIILYNSLLSGPQQQQVEAYLAQKWGLKSIFPSGHPAVTSIIYPNSSRRSGAFQQRYYTNFIPTSIAGCTLWLDGADSSMITLSGTNVTQLKDKSSNSYTLTGSVGSYPTQSTTLNGQPVISSATGQYLSLTNFNQNFTTATCFIVMRPTEDITPLNKYTNGYPQYRFIAGTVSGAVEFFITYANQTQTADTTKFTVSVNKNGTTLLYGALGGASPSTYNPINTPLLTSSVMSGSTGTNVVNLNGSSVTLSYNNSGTFSSQTPTLQCIGASSGQSFGYDFAEALIYGTTLSTTQIQQVESYLAQKWGLTASLPAGHTNTTNPAGTPAIVTQVYGQIKRTILYLVPPYDITYLLVAGGGAGGPDGNGSGGGGAGGVLTGTVRLASRTVYSFTIGIGGIVNGSGTQSGQNTTGFSLTAIGGGVGGSAGLNNAANGGSGGGVGRGVQVNGGLGTAGQGYHGGNNSSGTASWAESGGGGGAGGPGYDTWYNNGGGGTRDGTKDQGGIGISTMITGSLLYFGGGGGGGAQTSVGTQAPGGLGGGGLGGLNTANPTSGSPNTGGGGGGTSGYGQTSGSGGSGIVILSIPTVYYSGSISGTATVTPSGANTIIQFTGTTGSYTS